MTKRESLRSLKICSLSSISESLRNSPALQVGWKQRPLVFCCCCCCCFNKGYLNQSFNQLTLHQPKIPKVLELWSCPSSFQFLVLYLPVKIAPYIYPNLPLLYKLLGEGERWG